ncbi:MAG: RluA family pseudouridine synthase [Anaerolineales bacterium]|nr:MAG: RluA family pseudouridine synthase [Anaerolineales bacterium]
MPQNDSTPEERELTFAAETGGQRLDIVVAARVEDLSRSVAHRLIKRGLVTVNGEPRKASFRVQVGDAVSVILPEEKTEPVLAEDIPLDIVYEDDVMLVVNKLAGMVIHPALGHPSGTLVNALLAYCPQVADVGGLERAGIVHRLDKDTSGVVIVAKNEETRTALQKLFKRRRVEKTYVALVEDRIEPREGIIDAPIGRDKRNRKRMAVVRGAREAYTAYRVRRYIGDYSLLEVRPRTGRTHQIRVHLAWIGYPVVGDAVYGRRRQELLRGRFFLHAERLEFQHPATGRDVTVEAPLPVELEQVLKKLRRR